MGNCSLVLWKQSEGTLTRGRMMVHGVGCRYVGEWFETTDGKPLSEQQEEVSKALWNAVLIYIVIGGIAALGLCFHRVKNKMF